MILEQVSLRNWRAYRGDGHSFSFGEGANLLVGPNESGKSTILEAVRRGLLDRHSGKGKDIQQVRPLGSSLGPEVRLVFRCHGQRYSVLKRFLESVTSEVRVERNGEFQLDHEGDAADRFLRGLLLADDATLGSLRPEQRGLAQALWFLQSEDGIPGGRWSDAVAAGLREELSKPHASGLNELLSIAANSPQVEAVEKALGMLSEEHFTPTGRIKAKSEISNLEAALEELESELERRRSEQERAASHRAELQTLEEEDRSVVVELRDLSQRREKLSDGLQRGAKLSEEIRVLERRLERAQSQQAAAKAKRRSVDLLDARISSLDTTLRDSEEAEARLRVSVREHRRSAERHARNWEDQLSPKLESVRTSIADLKARQRIDQLEVEVHRLGEQIQRRAKLGGQLARAKERLQKTVIVDERCWEQAGRLTERARSLRERVWASGMRIALGDLPSGALKLDPQPDVDEKSGELVIVQETVVTVDGVGQFTLRSADERLAKFDREARACRQELAALLERFGAADHERLTVLREQTLAVQREVERTEDLLAEVAGLHTSGGQKSVEKSAKELERRHLEATTELRDLLERCPQSVLPGMEGWAEQRTHDELAELDERRQLLERGIREEREAEQAAQQESLRAHELLEKVSVSKASGQSEQRALRERLAEELETYSDRVAFESALAEATTEAERVATETKAVRKQIVVEIDRPKKELLGVEGRYTKAERRHQELTGQCTDRRARLDEVGALSLDRQIADLEVRVETTRKRLETVSRRAQATAVLCRLFERRRTRQSYSWIEPVGTLVEGWMERISVGRAVGVNLDADLVPQGIVLAGHEEPLPMASMSQGSSEQLLVLLRLALGVVLSQEERQMVVLDDRLVNADDARSAVLAEILNEVSGSCQVLIATCRAAGYESLSGRRIEVEQRGGFLAEARESS